MAICKQLYPVTLTINLFTGITGILTQPIRILLKCNGSLIRWVTEIHELCSVDRSILNDRGYVLFMATHLQGSHCDFYQHLRGGSDDKKCAILIDPNSIKCLLISTYMNDIFWWLSSDMRFVRCLVPTYFKIYNVFSPFNHSMLKYNPLPTRSYKWFDQNRPKSLYSTFLNFASRVSGGEIFI